MKELEEYDQRSAPLHDEKLGGFIHDDTIVCEGEGGE